MAKANFDKRINARLRDLACMAQIVSGGEMDLVVGHFIFGDEKTLIIRGVGSLEFHNAQSVRIGRPRNIRDDRYCLARLVGSDRKAVYEDSENLERWATFLKSLRERAIPLEEYRLKTGDHAYPSFPEREEALVRLARIDFGLNAFGY